jgi:hypothetical protein
MATTTTDTRDNPNVRPGIEFEPGRAEVWGYSQIDMRNKTTTQIWGVRQQPVSVPPLHDWSVIIHCTIHIKVFLMSMVQHWSFLGVWLTPETTNISHHPS